MVFTTTDVAPAVIIELEPHADERGFFARSWCQREFAAHGLNTRLAQCSISQNRIKGTLRGMHFQSAPHAEAKLVRCTAGAICDVIIDLRPGSLTFKRHMAITLSADNRRALYVPEGFAHGFLTLADNSEVLYQMSEFYEPAASHGVRWNDPAFGIGWPSTANRIVNDRDAAYPDFGGIAP